MELWAAEQLDENVKIRFRAGPEDVPKRSSDVSFEAKNSLGVAAVWESGEFEAEVVDIQTAERLIVLSAVLDDVVELRRKLDEVCAAVARGSLR